MSLRACIVTIAVMTTFVAAINPAVADGNVDVIHDLAAAAMEDISAQRFDDAEKKVLKAIELAEGTDLAPELTMSLAGIYLEQGRCEIAAATFAAVAADSAAAPELRNQAADAAEALRPCPDRAPALEPVVVVAVQEEPAPEPVVVVAVQEERTPPPPAVDDIEDADWTGVSLITGGGLLLAGGVVSALYTEGVITDFHSTAKAGTDRARFDGLKNDVESGLLRTNLLYASGSVILATGLVWMYLYPGEAGGTLFGLELRPNGASVHLSMEID
jgi:hypothetical protein